MINKGGRPKSDGKKPGWMLLRAMVVIEAFNRARRNEEKYEIALEKAVIAVNDYDSNAAISVSMVKKILKEFMPSGATEVFNVSRVPVQIDGASEGTENNSNYTASFGLKPVYPHPSNRNK